jgi:L-aspartate oxidase
VGLRRDAAGLADARARIAFWHHYLVRAPLRDRRACELANMLTVAAMVAESALVRTESRGTHFRSDFPERDDARYCRSIFLERTGDGGIRAELGPSRSPTDRGPA